MKSIIISMAIAAIAFSACNNSSNTSAESQPAIKDSASTTPAAEQVYACSMHPEVTGKKGDRCSKCGMELTEVKKDVASKTAPVSADVKATVSIKEIVSAYIQLKNAFTKDNTNDAATAGTSLETVFKTFDKTALTAGQKKTFEDVEDDAREHAEHIGKNGGNIKHQRDHFEMLSKDIADLIKTFGNGGQTLYKDFCPMYNNGKGAFWISETKEIQNPYFGKAMPTCGTMKEEIK